MRSVSFTVMSVFTWLSPSVGFSAVQEMTLEGRPRVRGHCGGRSLWLPVKADLSKCHLLDPCGPRGRTNLGFWKRLPEEETAEKGTTEQPVWMREEGGGGRRGVPWGSSRREAWWRGYSLARCTCPGSRDSVLVACGLPGS